MRVGVLSDTHGLLRPEVLTALAGCNHILHAGDVGDAAILDALRSIAPVTAIRGNIDESGHGQRRACSELPPIEIVLLGGQSIYILHDLKALDLDPVAAGFAAVISGHSHKPAIAWRKGVLYFNPGSCGPRRFSLPVSLGYLEIVGGSLKPSLLTIE